MKEPAVSEVIGAFLLIAIVMTGMIIIGVFMYSSPPPEASPQISFLVSCCHDDPDYQVIVAHQGGSPIRWSDIRFVLNENPVEPAYHYNATEIITGNCTTTGDTGTKWNSKDSTNFTKNGDSIKISVPGPVEMPHRLLIYETIGTNGTLLDTRFTCHECHTG